MIGLHTPGPWRWEINQQSKILHLVGGRPQYDLTVMDFDRWGMHRATISLRDTAHDGMNLMHKLHERSDWIAPFPGRAHHAAWCMNVIHPDARLMAAAPCLLKALQMAALQNSHGMSMTGEELRKCTDAIARATGEPT